MSKHNKAIQIYHNTSDHNFFKLLHVQIFKYQLLLTKINLPTNLSNLAQYQINENQISRVITLG